jgi:hypothetical protein
MTTKPKTRKAWNELGLKDRLLDLVNKGIADDERIVPCSACFYCHFKTCRKAGLFQLRQELLPAPGA